MVNLTDITTYTGKQEDFLKGKQMIAGVFVVQGEKKAMVMVDYTLNTESMRRLKQAFNEALDAAILMQEGREPGKAV
jgi:hypothetical protein